MEGRTAASDPSGHPARLEREALEGPTWQEEFETPEQLFARFKNLDYLRGRQANELGQLRRQVGLYERTIYLIARTQDPFELRALVQAAGLICEPKAHASIEQMLSIGEQALFEEEASHAV